MPSLRFSRARFCFCFLVWVLGLVGSLHADERLRIVAANLTSGNGQNYDEGHGSRILRGLQPDVVMVQEFNYLNNTDADFRAWVTENFGASFSYMREPNPSQIPNGVVSRYPILASGKWEDTQVSNRDFAWARIDIPGDKDLWVISVHLLTTSAANRNTEASLILNYIAAQGIPATDYVILGGDFNTASTTEACLNTLSSYFVTSGSWPVDQAGSGDTNRNRNKPYDHVLADTDLNALKVPVVIGTQSFPNGLVFDSRVYTPLPTPVLATDSAATNMQHMAVVRDFLIPTATTAPALPAIYSADTASGTAGQAFSYQIAATNNPTSFAATGLPAGLSVSSTSGLISGTPTAAGSTTITLSATNTSGAGTATLALTIVAAGSGGGVTQPGVELLREDFAALTTGNDTSTGGAAGSSLTTFAPNFPTCSTFYSAGGAVKLGSGSSTGSMTSKVLNLSGSGGAFIVSFKVKGWTTIEGDIKVTVTGLTAQTVTYTNVLGGTYVTKTLNFTGGTANSTVTIATTANRAFIDDVVISSAAVVATPTLATSGTLAAVNTTYGTASPTPTSFSVSGTDLTAGILVTPPAGFEVSQTTGGASGYASTQTVSPAGASGTVAATTVYVRLTASTAAGNYVGVITCSSTGATSVTVPVASSAVARRSLTITAQDRSKPFGQTFNAGSSAFTSSGLVSGQTIGAVTLNAVGGTAAYDAAGSYSIFASGAAGGTFVATNYSISYVQGTLSVTAPTYAEWATGLSNTAPSADPDGDGVVNLLEYYEGLDPETSDGLTPQIHATGTELSIDYRHSKTANGVTGTVEWTADLSGTAIWSDAEVTDELLESHDLYELRRATVPVNTGETKKFLRLRITQP